MFQSTTCMLHGIPITELLGWWCSHFSYINKYPAGCSHDWWNCLLVCFLAYSPTVAWGAAVVLSPGILPFISWWSAFCFPDFIYCLYLVVFVCALVCTYRREVALGVFLGLTTDKHFTGWASCPGEGVWRERGFLHVCRICVGLHIKCPTVVWLACSHLAVSFWSLAASLHWSRICSWPFVGGSLWAVKRPHLAKCQVIKISR